jgi:hypothetical protein
MVWAEPIQPRGHPVFYAEHRRPTLKVPLAGGVHIRLVVGSMGSAHTGVAATLYPIFFRVWG